MSDESKQLVTQPQRQPTEAESEFALEQRKATMFALSPLVPEHLRNGGKETAIANCYIAMVLAKQMGENPLVVMQNIYIVKGKAGWSSQYMIAKANASGLFRGGLRFKTEGKGGDTLAVTCSAVYADAQPGDPEPSITVSMEMAKAEGWVSNSKYKSMPEQMLRYRAAAFFVRTYCPQVMLGYQTVEEIEDVVAAELPTRPKLSMATVTETPTAQQMITGEIITESGEVITVKPEPAKQAEKTDMLASLLVEIEKRGGLATFYEQQQTDDMAIANMSKPSRSKLCTAANAFLTTLIQDAGE